MKKISVGLNPKFKAYELECRNFFPEELENKLPFGSMQAIVKPLQTSLIHNHHETELFYIVEGEGEVTEDKETTTVSKGDVVLLSEFSNHTITNTSESKELVFLTFWWEDKNSIENSLDNLNIMTGKDVLVTATAPTPNGDLHLGHMSGPYLGADIFSRFMRFQGNRVFYLTGTDINQTYVYTKSLQKDVAPQVLADINSGAIKATLQKGLINYDGFYEPTKDLNYNEQIQDFFIDLYNNEKLEVKKISAYFDQDRYLHEAYIKGSCPHCDSTSDGNCCEKCGMPHDAVALKNPVSFFDGNLVEKEISVLSFPLEKYRKELVNYYASLDLMAHHKSYIDKLFSKPLPDIPVSHPTAWGIKHKIPKFEDQIIYVWAEMLPAYLYSTQLLSDKNWNDYNHHIQFYGFDNTFYHLVLFPAMLIANKQYKLPDSFVINEFLNLDGSKFSTSREHLIWAKDFLSENNPELVRMYLARVRPEQSESNFSVNDYCSYIEKEIEGRLIKNINRFWDIIDEVSDSKIPEAGAWNASTKQSYKVILDSYNVIISAHQASSFSTHLLMKNLENLSEVLESNCNMLDFLKNINLEKDLVRTLIAISSLAIKTISIAMVGIAPNFSKRLMSEISPSDQIKIENQLSFVASGQIVSPKKQEYF